MIKKRQLPHGTREHSAVPDGTKDAAYVYPALKRWANSTFFNRFGFPRRFCKLGDITLSLNHPLALKPLSRSGLERYRCAYITRQDSAARCPYQSARSRKTLRESNSMWNR